MKCSTAFPTPNCGELDNGFAVTEELIRRYADYPRITAAVMPHALYICSLSLSAHADRLAEDLDADVNIPLFETLTETATVKKRYGKQPLEHMAALGLLGRRWCASTRYSPSTSSRS
jgi:5-methylthioadenosine/S-adenosylhomocysteine deaminase